MSRAQDEMAEAEWLQPQDPGFDLDAWSARAAWIVGVGVGLGLISMFAMGMVVGGWL